MKLNNLASVKRKHNSFHIGFPISFCFTVYDNWTLRKLNNVSKKIMHVLYVKLEKYFHICRPGSSKVL